MKRIALVFVALAVLIGLAATASQISTPGMIQIVADSEVPL
jgi:hypothetical protein